MALALKKEGLAIASGNKVYLYSYSGDVRKLAERDGEVMSLAVYYDRLIDSGNYKGIRDTLTGNIVLGKKSKWRRIANWQHYGTVHKKNCDEEYEIWTETIFGAKETEDEGEYGIFELTGEWARETYPQYQRNGKTNVLASWIVPVDAGEYIVYSPEKEFYLAVGYIHDHIDYPVAYDPADFPITSFLGIGNLAYYTTPYVLTEVQPADQPWKWKRKAVFTLPTDLFAQLSELENLQFKDDPLSRQLFLQYAAKLSDIFPPDVFMHEGKSILSCHDINYMAIRSLISNLKLHCKKIDGMSALSYAESRAFVGCRNGDLVLPYSSLQEKNQYILHNFDHPINALQNVPEEIMDGLRQRIIRNIQMRAVHAKSSKAVAQKAA